MSDKQLAQVLALPSSVRPPYASTEEGLGELNVLLSAQETALTRGRWAWCSTLSSGAKKAWTRQRFY